MGTIRGRLDGPASDDDSGVRPQPSRSPEDHCSTMLELAPANAVVAWRFWTAVDVDGKRRLRSQWAHDLWPERGPLRATCRSRHRAPDADCHCGIWAHESRDEVDVRVDTASALVGRVRLYGRVAREWDGTYRAEYAEPLGDLAPYRRGPPRACPVCGFHQVLGRDGRWRHWRGIRPVPFVGFERAVSLVRHFDVGDPIYDLGATPKTIAEVAHRYRTSLEVRRLLRRRWPQRY